MSLADDIFAIPCVDSLLVTVPEWPQQDGKLFAKAFTVGELMDLKAWWRDGLLDGTLPDDADVMAKTVIAGIMDNDGQPVFSHGDLAKLKALPGRPVVRLFQKLAEINGLTEAAADAIKKKSVPTPS